jgi:hypothetical protein
MKGHFQIWLRLSLASNLGPLVAVNSGPSTNFLSRLRCGLLAAGSALRNASRTIRRCTPNFRDTPAIVPTPDNLTAYLLKQFHFFPPGQPATLLSLHP